MEVLRANGVYRLSGSTGCVNYACAVASRHKLYTSLEGHGPAVPVPITLRPLGHGDGGS